MEINFKNRKVIVNGRMNTDFDVESIYWGRGLKFTIKRTNKQNKHTFHKINNNNSVFISHHIAHS